MQCSEKCLWFAFTYLISSTDGHKYDYDNYPTHRPPKTLPMYSSDRFLELTRLRTGPVDLILLVPKGLRTSQELQGDLDVTNKLRTLFFQSNVFAPQSNGLQQGFITYQQDAQVISGLGGSIAGVGSPKFAVDTSPVNIHKALKAAYEVFLQGRPGANKVLVLFIGSNPVIGEAVHPVAEKLKKLGVEIWVIAGGSEIDPDLVLSITDDSRIVFFENFTQSTDVQFEVVEFVLTPSTTITTTLTTASTITTTVSRTKKTKPTRRPTHIYH